MNSGQVLTEADFDVWMFLDLQVIVFGDECIGNSMKREEQQQHIYKKDVMLTSGKNIIRRSIRNFRKYLPTCM